MSNILFPELAHNVIFSMSYLLSVVLRKEEPPLISRDPQIEGGVLPCVKIPQKFSRAFGAILIRVPPYEMSIFFGLRPKIDRETPPF